MRRTTRLTALLGATALTMALAACGGDGGGGAAPAPESNALDDVEGVTDVTFWHSMDGSNGEALQGLVDQFNADNEGTIAVEAVFQGGYDDTITKYKASVQSGSTPDLVQIYDIGTRFMIDSEQVVPMQEFIDRDDYDVSDLQPNIAGYYSVDDNLWSMPFNTSMPVLYYNKTMFEAAGLDPEEAPTSLEEIRTAAEKLSAANGGPVEFGFGAAIYGWLIEQYVASNGAEYCDEGNGRDAKATEVLFDGPEAVEMVEWWQKMVADGLASNTGRDTKAAQNAFKAGQVAMTLESTGQVTGFTTAATEGGFELGVGTTPRPARTSPVRSSAAPRSGSAARATTTPRRKPPGGSSSSSPSRRARPPGTPAPGTSRSRRPRSTCPRTSSGASSTRSSTSRCSSSRAPSSARRRRAACSA